MKILMILDSELPDQRVEKEALILIQNGHEVSVMCLSSGNKQKRITVFKGINIYRIKLNKHIRKKLHALYLILPIYKWIWSYHINKKLNKETFHALHIHDLPLSDIGLRMKNKYELKLICDQHEYYSNWIVQTKHLNTFLGKIVNRLSNWKSYEKKYLRKADLVITIEEPLRQEYIRQVDISPDNIINLPNTPLKEFSKIKIDQKIKDHYKDYFVLFYAGGISALRGLNVPLKAIKKISKKIPNIKIVLAGKVSSNNEIITKAKELKVDKYIDFTGWVSLESIPSYISASDICFHVPIVSREETNKTIATKIYQYIVIGKPIICSDAKMMKELIENNKIGLSISSGNAEDFADKVIELYNNPEIRKKYEDNCNKIADRVIWENTSKKMIQKYKSL